MRILFRAIISAIIAMSCHSDYYPDGHRKGSWGAYKDFDGPIEWQTYCFYLESRLQEFRILDSLYRAGVKTKEDTIYYRIEYSLWRKHDDSVRKYEKYSSKWD